MMAPIMIAIVAIVIAIAPALQIVRRGIASAGAIASATVALLIGLTIIYPALMPLRARSEVIAAARQLRRASDASDLRRLTEAAARHHRREERLLLVLALSGGTSGVSAKDLEDAGVRSLQQNMRDIATLAGVSERTLPDGRGELIVYFRPLTAWRGRALWLHAYAPGSHDYVDVAPEPPAFDGWRIGELAWERFELPAPGRFHVYVGVADGGGLGPAYAIPTATPTAISTATPPGAAIGFSVTPFSQNASNAPCTVAWWRFAARRSVTTSAPTRSAAKAAAVMTPASTAS
jgi:hypothetical protein